jgi:hypothetical protein
MPYSIINFYTSQKEILSQLQELDEPPSFLVNLQQQLNTIINNAHHIMSIISTKNKLDCVCKIELSILHHLKDLNISLGDIVLTDNEVIKSTCKYIKDLDIKTEVRPGEMIEKLCLLTDTLSNCYLLNNGRLILSINPNKNILKSTLEQLIETINTHLTSLESSELTHNKLLTEYFCEYYQKTKRFSMQNKPLFPRLTHIDIIKKLSAQLLASQPKTDDTISLSSNLSQSIPTNTPNVQKTHSPVSLNIGSANSSTVFIEPSSTQPINVTISEQAELSYDLAQVPQKVDNAPNSTDLNLTELHTPDELEFDQLLQTLEFDRQLFDWASQQVSTSVITEQPKVVNTPPNSPDSNLTRRIQQDAPEFDFLRDLDTELDFPLDLDLEFDFPQFDLPTQQVSASVITDVSKPLLNVNENIQALASTAEITTCLDAEEEFYDSRTKQQPKGAASQVSSAQYGQFFQKTIKQATKKQGAEKRRANIADKNEEQPAKRPPCQPEQELVIAHSALTLKAKF